MRLMQSTSFACLDFPLATVTTQLLLYTGVVRIAFEVLGSPHHLNRASESRALPLLFRHVVLLFEKISPDSCALEQL